jgi:hypothetical protein
VGRLPQVGFFKVVVLPQLQHFTAAFPAAQPLLDCALSNYNHWRNVSTPAATPAHATSTDNSATPMDSSGLEEAAAVVTQAANRAGRPDTGSEIQRGSGGE